MYYKNGCRIYVDIRQRKISRQFRLQFPLASIGLTVYLVGMEGWGKKEGVGEIYNLAWFRDPFFYRT